MIRDDVVHSTFAIARTYDATPERVFAAWSRPEHKARWFVGPESWRLVDRSLDFRIGGTERLHGRFEGGVDTVFTSTFFDIVPDRRIVYAYEMDVDGRRISVSLATVCLTPEGGGTRMTVTEQGTFFGGQNAAEGREKGTAELIDRLGRSLHP